MGATWSPPAKHETTHIRALPVGTGELSRCCSASVSYDSTRHYCTKCFRVLWDINDGSIGDESNPNWFLCTGCGGAGDLDDITTCEDCDGDGMVEC